MNGTGPRASGGLRTRAHAADWRQIGPVGVALAACACLCGPLLIHPSPRLLWNASASSPTGLYRVTPSAIIRRGDSVVAWAPEWARRLAAARGYLPVSVPLVKQVAAVAGDRLCASGTAIFINGRAAAMRRSRDPTGRPMPWWAGCHRLRPGELFLLNAKVPQAFDGRYFGVTSNRDVIGTARLLWRG